jgi:hypothetical protein
VVEVESGVFVCGSAGGYRFYTDSKIAASCGSYFGGSNRMIGVPPRVF